MIISIKAGSVANKLEQLLTETKVSDIRYLDVFSGETTASAILDEIRSYWVEQLSGISLAVVDPEGIPYYHISAIEYAAGQLDIPVIEWVSDSHPTMATLYKFNAQSASVERLMTLFKFTSGFVSPESAESIADLIVDLQRAIRRYN